MAIIELFPELPGRADMHDAAAELASGLHGSFARRIGEAYQLADQGQQGPIDAGLFPIYSTRPWLSETTAHKNEENRYARTFYPKIIEPKNRPHSDDLHGAEIMPAIMPAYKKGLLRRGFSYAPCLESGAEWA
jgi:hypothetical protein